MNKQEALKQIEEQRDMILDLHGWGVFGYIKGIINQLDEPQKIELPKVDFKKSSKVKVPQFVADWIEVCKEHLTTSLYTAMNPDFMKENNQSFDFILWIKKTSNQDLFARAWLDGYEIEEEKRYLVKIKGNIKENMLVYGELLERYFFTKSLSLDNAIYSHTRKDLEEAGFGWVFDCPGIDVEEVE
nr:MAG TPA: Protein of unknown function (DUF1642) [Caudoviricetes sp.]